MRRKSLILYEIVPNAAKSKINYFLYTVALVYNMPNKAKAN